jgi:hypothetical protein
MPKTENDSEKIRGLRRDSNRLEEPFDSDKLIGAVNHFGHRNNENPAVIRVSDFRETYFEERADQLVTLHSQFASLDERPVTAGRLRAVDRGRRVIEGGRGLKPATLLGQANDMPDSRGCPTRGPRLRSK